MNPKLVILLALIGVAVAHPRFDEKLEEICGDDDDCIAAGEECLAALKPERDGRPSEEEREAKREEMEEKLDFFNECLEDEGLDTIELPEGGRRGRGRGRRGRRGKGGKGGLKRLIEDTLDELDDGVATDVRCCFGEKLGLLDSDGNIDKDAVEDKLEEKITDTDILADYVAGIATCAAEVTDCNLEDFHDCLLEECIDAQ